MKRRKTKSNVSLAKCICDVVLFRVFISLIVIHFRDSRDDIESSGPSENTK